MGRTKDLFNKLRDEELQEEIFFNKKNITFY